MHKKYLKCLCFEYNLLLKIFDIFYKYYSFLWLLGTISVWVVTITYSPSERLYWNGRHFRENSAVPFGSSRFWCKISNNLITICIKKILILILDFKLRAKTTHLFWVFSSVSVRGFQINFKSVLVLDLKWFVINAQQIDIIVNFY